MEERIIIVDYMHLVYSYSFAQYNITAYVEIDGRAREVSTKLHKGISNVINTWTRGGKDKVIVCVDSPIISRKAYFNRINKEKGVEKTYKEGRKNLPDSILESAEQVLDLLRDAGIPVCRGYDYEADDLIFNVVCQCKDLYPDTPIDIITNDADLLPLVDQQVSVFLRSVRFTSATEKRLEKKHYVQITPDNFEQEVIQRGEYKKIRMPYNTTLLYKLLRGDKSDNIIGYPKKFTPKKYNEMIEKMEADDVDFANIFRYGRIEKKFINKKTGDVVVDINQVDPKECKVVFSKPSTLEGILNVMSKYTDEDVLKHIEQTYRGLNLNGVFMENGQVRIPARVKELPKTYSQDRLMEVLKKWNVKIARR